MKENEDLNQYVNTYSENLFHDENVRGLHCYINHVIQSVTNFDQFLELGIGHGVVMDTLRQKFKQVIVLEGSPVLVNDYQDKYQNVEIIETYFETFSSKAKFQNIGMGFILEHVDDPVAILNKYAKFLTENGRIFIGVPSASSMHRILAKKAGMLENLEQMSETDIAFGHKRSWVYKKWQDLLNNTGFKIEKAYGIAFKPFTTEQLDSLNLDPRIMQALDDLSIEYPELANGIFFEVSYDHKLIN